jgi:tripartite-type tricarboxylate transporter receptor subunit TctC
MKRSAAFLRARGAAIATLGATLTLAAGPVLGQSWPSKPIRVIVPLTAGSATDVIPRIVFEQVSAQLGQSMVVENRVGGGGTIGVAAVAKAEPDGYTILVHSNAHAIAPAVHPNLPYDVVKDFSGITPLGNVPNVLVIAPSKNIKTIQDLVAAAKAKPGSINYASGGLCQFRFRFLVRHVRPGQDPARDRPKTSPGDGEGAAEHEREGQARQPRR